MALVITLSMACNCFLVAIFIFQHFFLELLNRAFLFPRIDLFFGAITGTLVGITLMVPAPPIGLAFDQGGPLAGASPLNRFGSRFVDFQHIITVYNYTGDIVSDGPGCNICDRCAFGLADRDPVSVVFTYKNNGKFMQGCQIQTLVEGAVAG